MYIETYAEKIIYKYDDAKVWFGEKVAKEMSQLGNEKERIARYFQQLKGITYKEAYDELTKFENAEFVLRTRSHEASTKMGFRFKKLKETDLDTINGNLAKLAAKIKEKYKTSQEETMLQIKMFMSNFSIV